MANTRFGLGAGNVGTPGTGVSAVEYGDGRDHVTVLTLAQTDAFSVADNAALCVGSLIYTLPAGAYDISACHMDVEANHADGESAAGAGEMAVGNVIGAGAAATIGAGTGTTGGENIAGPLASVDTADAAVSTATHSGLAVADTGSRLVYLNMADTWADVVGTDLTVDLAGTVVLKWSQMT